jgi:pantetheine-phosphate adenylyltransferase
MTELYKHSGKTPDLDVIERIKSYILATEHAEPPRNHDEALIMDIDLAYTASHNFSDVENWIRQEYRWVPRKVYSRARKNILIKLLIRDPIFYTPIIQEVLGKKMKRNLFEMIRMNGARVAMGGTFDLLHAGHKKLIDTAFAFAGVIGNVEIGITSDVMASKKTHPVQPYTIRKRQISDYIKQKNYPAKYKIFPLDDPVGNIGIEPDYDVLVASTETGAGAEYVNEIRRMHGLNPVLVSLIDVVTDKTGQRISSTRMRAEKT